jgi:hypothetical protein
LQQLVLGTQPLDYKNNIAPAKCRKLKKNSNHQAATPAMLLMKRNDYLPHFKVVIYNVQLLVTHLQQQTVSVQFVVTHL